MTTHFFSYCEFNLGDNLAHLHFLRKMALAHAGHSFVHFANECHLAQMNDVVCDIPTISLRSFRPPEPSGRNVWKNAGGFWEHHRLRNDYANFYIAWFQHLAAEMGLESPIKQPSDLLFDYPKLLEPAWPGEEFDYLVINSRPCSGQFMAYDRVDYFDPLIEKLCASGKSVVCTQDSVSAAVSGAKVTCRQFNTVPPLTITQIGNLSLRCKNIIAVATGPLWPTLSVWAKPEKRIICLDCPERNIIDPQAIYCRNLAEVEKEVGL